MRRIILEGIRSWNRILIATASHMQQNISENIFCQEVRKRRQVAEVASTQFERRRAGSSKSKSNSRKREQEAEGGSCQETLNRKLITGYVKSTCMNPFPLVLLTSLLPLALGFSEETK